MWSLEWGGDLRLLAEIAAEGTIVPKALLNRPQCRDDNVEYLDAFFQLTQTRPAGFGVSAIAFQEIAAFLSLNPTDDVELFQKRIRAADRAFLEWHAKRTAAKG